MQESLSVELPVEPRSAAWAREALADFRDRLQGDAFIDLQLIVSELVADAVRGDEGTSEPIVLRIELLDRHIQVAVREGGRAYGPVSRRPQPGERGWGLHLAGVLAEHWGSRHEADRGCVWVQMPLAAPDEVAQGRPQRLREDDPPTRVPASNLARRRDR
jgi:anti-sigma regulatory factor (Ser/Thr protein kinase)